MKNKIRLPADTRDTRECDDAIGYKKIGYVRYDTIYTIQHDRIRYHRIGYDTMQLLADTIQYDRIRYDTII